MNRLHTVYRALYFLLHFYSDLYCKAVSITDSVCTKQGNSSIFEPKIHGLLLRAVSNQELGIMARVLFFDLYDYHLAVSDVSDVFTLPW